MSVEHYQLPELPVRPNDAHKGVFGHVLVIGGSLGMSGAVSLSGLSALRGGAGLVTVACPMVIQPQVASYNPSYLTWGLPHDQDGLLNDSAMKEIISRLHHYDVLAIGPGLGKSTLLKLIIRELYLRASLPMVIDADALNALSSLRMDLSEHEGPRILTPHPGEFSRFVRLSISDIMRNRTELAKQFASTNKLTLLLKGEDSIVTDGESLYCNDSGNSGLATGGTGDVLTGLIASLLAQGSTPLDATILATYLHGRSADIYASQKSSRSMIASDLPEYIGLAYREMERSQFKHFGNS